MCIIALNACLLALLYVQRSRQGTAHTHTEEDLKVELFRMPSCRLPMCTNASRVVVLVVPIGITIVNLAFSFYRPLSWIHVLWLLRRRVAMHAGGQSSCNMRFGTHVTATENAQVTAQELFVITIYYHNRY